MLPKLPRALDYAVKSLPVPDPQPIRKTEDVVRDLKARFNLTHGKGKRKRKGKRK